MDNCQALNYSGVILPLPRNYVIPILFAICFTSGMDLGYAWGTNSRGWMVAFPFPSA
jgi:hypothetical protein